MAESTYDENCFTIESGFVRFSLTRIPDEAGEIELKSERKTDLRWNSIILTRAQCHNMMRWLDGDL